MKTKSYKSQSFFRFVRRCLIIVVMISGEINLFSQYPVNYQYTLLPSKTIDEILGASSGDLAMKHIIELAGYDRPRTDSEYSEFPLETNYIIEKLKEYGLDNVRVDKFGKSLFYNRSFGNLRFLNAFFLFDRVKYVEHLLLGFL